MATPTAGTGTTTPSPWSGWSTCRRRRTAGSSSACPAPAGARPARGEPADAVPAHLLAGAVPGRPLPDEDQHHHAPRVPGPARPPHHHQHELRIDGGPVGEGEPQHHDLLPRRHRGRVLRTEPVMKRIVLAFSGGLDTSVALVWLRETYQCPVVAFIADVGQNEDLEAIGRRARDLGAESVHIMDLREQFARDFVFPMHRADARYEGQYLLGSPIARPLIAEAQLRVAEEVGADAVSHGCTGKGNCQARFEVAYAALRPDLNVIVPWREWDLGGRTDLLAYADKHSIELDLSSGERPYSIDANLLHTCYEGEVLEDPAIATPASLRQRVRDIADTPEEPELVRISFERGDPVAVNDERLSPAALLGVVTEIGSRHGVGRLDMVENRINGVKTRTVSEAPAGT